MDLGWINTLASTDTAPPQISIMSGGGSGAAVPARSIEVGDVDATHNCAVSMNAQIKHPLTLEPWGVCRFYVYDPADTLNKTLSHSG